MFFLFPELLKKEKKPKNTVKKEIINGFEVKFQKHAFSRSIRISIKNGYVLTTLPKYSSYKMAREFVLSKMSWIEANYKEKKENNDKETRHLAKKILPKRLEELSKKYGFKYNKVRLTNAKKRWGSCSWQNNINLNINLAKLDGEIIDYVILHELCHTKIKNHSKKFWDLVLEKMPNALEIRKRLKKIAP